MTRMKAPDGTVHFGNPAHHLRTLCAVKAEDIAVTLLGAERTAWPVTVERVTCPNCAKVYCAVKNQPWNALGPFTEDALERGIYAAVQPDGPLSTETTTQQEDS